MLVCTPSNVSKSSGSCLSPEFLIVTRWTLDNTWYSTMEENCHEYRAEKSENDKRRSIAEQRILSFDTNCWNERTCSVRISYLYEPSATDLAKALAVPSSGSIVSVVSSKQSSFISHLNNIKPFCLVSLRRSNLNKRKNVGF